MAKLRTIKAAMREIQLADPGTAFSEHLLRKLIKKNKIPYIKAGNRYLFDVDKLPEILEKLSSSQSDDAFVSVNFQGSRVKRI